MTDMIEGQAPEAPAEPVLNEVEERASTVGWRPKEEWEGNPEDWVDAKEFLARGGFIDRIKEQSSIIKKMQKTIASMEQDKNVLIEHYKKVRETEYKRALNDLKAQRKEAYQYGDLDLVDEIDDQIQELKVEVSKPTAQPEPEVHQDIVEFMDNNPWYGPEGDILLTEQADRLASKMVQLNPSLNKEPKKVLDKVLEVLKEEYPHKFGAQSKPARKSSVLEPGDVPHKSKGKKYSARDIPSEFLPIAKQLVSMGAVESLDKYAEDYFNMNKA